MIIIIVRIFYGGIIIGFLFVFVFLLHILLSQSSNTLLSLSYSFDHPFDLDLYFDFFIPLNLHFSLGLSWTWGHPSSLNMWISFSFPLKEKQKPSIFILKTLSMIVINIFSQNLSKNKNNRVNLSSSLILTSTKAS